MRRTTTGVHAPHRLTDRRRNAGPGPGESGLALDEGNDAHGGFAPSDAPVRAAIVGSIDPIDT